MTPAVHGLLLWALLLGGTQHSEQSPGEGIQGPAKPTSVTLTNDHPTGFFILDPETIASAPPVVAVSLTRVVNPNKTPFQVFVYLSYLPEAGEKPRTQRILIGNFGLYPPDRPGGARLRASNAFRQLKAARPKPTEVRLVLELKRIHERRPWTPIEVTVAPPNWQAEG